MLSQRKTLPFLRFRHGRFVVEHMNHLVDGRLSIDAPRPHPQHLWL